MCFDLQNTAIFATENDFLRARRFVAAYIAGEDTREDDAEAVKAAAGAIIMRHNTVDGEATFLMLCKYIRDENAARGNVCFLADKVLADRLPHSCAANAGGRPDRHVH
ncbi:MAG: hypothetical protein VX730_02090 [Pseudomonadota bacterium]|nr:hypothetical protein [Pseudomonadota bacterium]